MYGVKVTPSAARQMRKLPKVVRERIVEAIESLRSDPRPRGVRKLRGANDRYRIRVGDFRIIYEIHDRELAIVVVRVADRKAIY